MKKFISLLFLLSALGFMAPTAQAACIVHLFVSAKPDSVDTTLIRPSDWNACHVIEAGTIVEADLAFDPATQTELDAHINDASAAHAASAISADSTTLVGTGTTVQAVFEELDNAIVAVETSVSNHLADTTDAHDASAISAVSTTLVGTATDVQGVLEELDNAIVATETSIANHIADSTAAHAATAISVSSTNLDGTSITVQGALEELEDQIDTKSTATGTTNQIAKFTSSNTIGDSSCADDGAGTISCGDVSGNHYEETFSAATGTHAQNHPAVSGDFAITTGAKTNGKVPQYDSVGRLVDGTALAALKTKQFVFRLGSDTGTELVDTDDEANIWPERIAAMTITSVKCWSDADTVIINLQRDDGSAANILSSNLSCTSGGATGSIAGAEDNLATTDKVNFVMVTAGGVGKRVTVSIMATID